MPTYQKMNVKSLTAKLRNVSYLDMMNSQKAIGCMIVKTRLHSRDVRFNEQSNDTVVESKPEQNPDRAISIDS